MLLFKVSTRVDTLPNAMVAGLKDLLRVGATATGVGVGLTVKVATAGETLLPLLVCNAPEGKELI